MTSRLARLTVALALAVSAARATAQQPQRGDISGRVTDTTNQQPVPSAQVIVVGTSRGVLTNDRGEYQLRNVPAGTVQLRALRIGYAASTQTVTVTAGAMASADFALSPTPSQLTAVVVTATGEQEEKREIPASIGTVNVDSLNLAPVQTFSDVLTSRTPGVVAQSAGGTAGTGTRIRIRGSSSVSLTNDPLVIIDGVRANDEQDSFTIGVGGQSFSRLDDLNPEDIERIDIIKGPAAASLYGTAASNGVIQVTTKRGRPGKTQWSSHIGFGTVRNYVDFPANYSAVEVQGADTVFGTPTTSGIGCTTDFQLRGFCTRTGLASFNPLEQVSPFDNGLTQSYGLSAAGGGNAATYYVSGEFDHDQGIYEINKVRRANLRANIAARLRDNLDLTVNTGYLQSRARLPQNDNNIRGIIPGGLLGSAFNDSVFHGYGFDKPENIFAIDTRQKLERYNASVTSNWSPLSWLSLRGVSGLDFTNRLDQELIPSYLNTGVTSRFADDSLGQRTSNPYQIFVYTLNGNATASYGLGSQLSASSSVGAQYNNTTARGTQAFGKVLAAGTGSLNGATTQFQVDEENSEVITLGAYVQQQLNWRDRVYVSGALRADKNNSFGREFKTVYYPSLGASWVISDEGFFPKSDWLNALRLRAAFGQSGRQPGFRDAQRYFSPVSVTVKSGQAADQSEPGFTVGNLGNPRLKPERSTEFEVGFESSVIKNRLALDFTYYDKQTRDALILRPLPPSNGDSLSRFENLGRVSNKGVEFQLAGTPVMLRNFRWDLTLTGSHNANKVVDLGSGIKPIIFNASYQRHQNGFPLGGYWAQTYTFEDKNGDGVISRINCPGQPTGDPSLECEVALGDTAFLGSPFPKTEISISSGITAFKYFRLSGLLDRRSGFKLLNVTERFRCVSFGTCLTANNDVTSPVSSLAEQARYVAGLMGTDAGYVEDASFWKLREVALTVTAPDAWASRFGLTNLSVTFAGRNLGTWTDYTGLDPEINENGQLNFFTDEFLSQPPVRTYAVRLDLRW